MANQHSQGEMVSKLKNKSFNPLQFKLNGSRPDLTKLDKLFGMLNAESSTFGDELTEIEKQVKEDGLQKVFESLHLWAWSVHVYYICYHGVSGLLHFRTRGFVTFAALDFRFCQICDPGDSFLLHLWPLSFIVVTQSFVFVTFMTLEFHFHSICDPAFSFLLHLWPLRVFKG